MLKYFKDLYRGLITPFQGMRITSHYIFTPRVTKKYPEAYEPVLPPAERNRLDVNMTKCTGCKMCANSCPAKAITIDTIKAVPSDTNVPTDENGKPKKLLVSKFDIDFGLCCYCALCEEACNFGAIYRTPVFDYSTYYRKELKHHYSKMTTEQIKEKKELLAKYNAEQKAAQAAKATEA
jgi:NADH-quinone oxidoreductase subunit I